MKITRKKLEKIIKEELNELLNEQSAPVMVGGTPEDADASRRSMRNKGPLTKALNKYADTISRSVDWMIMNDQHGPAAPYTDEAGNKIPAETFLPAASVLTELQLALRMLLQHAELRYDFGANEGDGKFLEEQPELETNMSSAKPTT